MGKEKGQFSRVYDVCAFIWQSDEAAWSGLADWRDVHIRALNIPGKREEAVKYIYVDSVDSRRKLTMVASSYYGGL